MLATPITSVFSRVHRIDEKPEDLSQSMLKPAAESRNAYHRVEPRQCTRLQRSCIRGSHTECSRQAKTRKTETAYQKRTLMTFTMKSPINLV